MFSLDQQYCFVLPLPPAVTATVAVTRLPHRTLACCPSAEAPCVAAAYQADILRLAYKHIPTDHHNHYYMLPFVAHAACFGLSRHALFFLLVCA